MKLSELKSDSFKLVQAGNEEAEPLKLSSLPVESFKIVQAQPKGKDVYEQPVGPEQASGIERFKERMTDPKRWQASLFNTGPYKRDDIVQGDLPLVIPGGAIPKLAKAAVALSEGAGASSALGRIALSTAQGAGMSLAGGKEGESLGNKYERMKDGAKLSGGIQLAVESLPVVGRALGYAGRKIGQAVSGVDESILQNYAQRTDEVNEVIKKSGGDITEAADQVRTELSEGIQSAKSKLSAQISRTLQKASPDRNIPIQPLVDKLEAAKARLNPNYKSGAIADIDEMIASIKSEAPDGMVNVSSLYQTKQFLNENAKASYNKGGQIFNRASEASRAAKEAAGDARTMLKPVAGAISEADGQLSKLHAIESRLNKNLLAPGKSDAALLAAGSGANPRNAASLRKLEEISGVPVSQRARDLATAKAFANPSLNPTDWTGKATARMLTAAGLGYAVNGQEGAILAGGVASPMAMKLGINGINVAKQIAGRFPSFAEFTRKNPLAAQTIIQLVSGQIRKANQPKEVEITPEVQEYFQENPQLLQNVTDPAFRARLESKSGRDPSSAETPKIKHGTIRDGRIFYGGDQNDPKNWKLLKKKGQAQP